MDKEYECKICGKDLWGDDPSDDPPVSEFCSNDCHILFLEAMISRLEARIDNHIMRCLAFAICISETPGLKI